jgi:hypothetical protein
VPSDYLPFVYVRRKLEAQSVLRRSEPSATGILTSGIRELNNEHLFKVPVPQTQRGIGFSHPFCPEMLANYEQTRTYLGVNTILILKYS